MKALTKNLMYFAIFFFIGAIAFGYSLSHFLESRSYSLVWITAGIYLFFNVVIGWFFGKRDYESLPLYDIGFRFHFVTYLVFNSVAFVWFSLGIDSNFQNISIVYNIALYWGIGLLFHFISYLSARKDSIQGLNKEEIFE